MTNNLFNISMIINNENNNENSLNKMEDELMNFKLKILS